MDSHHTIYCYTNVYFESYYFSDNRILPFLFRRLRCEYPEASADVTFPADATGGEWRVEIMRTLNASQHGILLIRQKHESMGNKESLRLSLFPTLTFL